MFEWILVIVLLIVNFAISCWNAYAVGSSKAYAEGLGIWSKMLLWSGWIMSAAGFTWVYMFLLGIAAYTMGYLDEVSLKVAFIAIVLLALFGGILTTHLIVQWASKRA